MGAVTEIYLIGSNHPKDVKSLAVNYIIEVWENSRISVFTKDTRGETGKKRIVSRMICESPDDKNDDILKSIKNVVKKEKISVFESNTIGNISVIDKSDKNLIEEIEKTTNYNILVFNLTEYKIYNNWEQNYESKGFFEK